MSEDINIIWPLPKQYNPEESMMFQKEKREKYLRDKFGDELYEKAIHTFETAEDGEGIFKAYDFAYKNELGYEFFPQTELSARIMTSYVLEKIKERTEIRILDLGCGPGKMSAALTTQDNIEKVVAMDRVESAIPLVLKNSRQMAPEFQNKLEAKVGNYEQEETRDWIRKQNYDLIIACFQRETPSQEALEACKTALVKKGELILCYPTHPFQSPMDPDYGLMENYPIMEAVFGECKIDWQECCTDYSIQIITGQKV